MVHPGFINDAASLAARKPFVRASKCCEHQSVRSERVSVHTRLLSCGGGGWRGPDGEGGGGRGGGDDGRGHDPRPDGFPSFMLAGAAASTARNDLSVDRKLRVVATTTIIADLAESLGGDFLDIEGLIKPGDDPHVYEAVPSDSIRIEEADVILYNGYDLEMNLMPLIRSSMHVCRHYAVAESVKPMPSSDSTNMPDPHVWNDAGNAARMVDAIAAAFCECDAEHKRVYAERARKMNQELKLLDVWIKKCIKSIPPKHRMLVTTHDAFQYYARAYGLTILGSLMGINTEEQPSAKTMSELISELRAVQPPAVFFEKTVSPLLIRAVADDADVALCDESLYSDSIGPEGESRAHFLHISVGRVEVSPIDTEIRLCTLPTPGSGAETYQRMMAYNTRVIVCALGGKISPPPPLAFSSSARK